MVMHRDGTVYHAEELSQGTCEQLYTAIRFALLLRARMGQCFRSSLTTALFILIKKG